MEEEEEVPETLQVQLPEEPEELEPQELEAAEVGPPLMEQIQGLVEKEEMDFVW
jgi:hypothetical protein